MGSKTVIQNKLTFKLDGFAMFERNLVFYFAFLVELPAQKETQHARVRHDEYLSLLAINIGQI